MKLKHYIMPKLYRSVTNDSMALVPAKRTKSSAQARRLPFRKNSVSKYSFAKVHSFKRTAALSTTGGQVLQLQSGPIAGGGWNSLGSYDLEFTFSLKQTQIYFGGVLTYSVLNGGYAEFANLFDFYRIDKVTVKWDFTSNTSSVGSGNQAPMLVVVKDFNDANTITYQECLQNGSAKTHILGNDRNITWTTVIVPKVQNVIYNGLTSAYAESISPPWLNSTNTDIPHYGVKCVYDPLNLSTRFLVGYLYPTFTYYISAKNSN